MRVLSDILRGIMKPKVSYEGASQGRRMNSWQPTENSINTIIYNDKKALVARSRDMLRKNAYAKNALETIVTNTIGKGVVPLLRYKDKQFMEDAKKLWSIWVNDCDIFDRHSFYGLQDLACREMVAGGEVFLRIVDLPDNKNMSVPFKLQMLETEQLDTSKVLSGKNNVQGGLEFDKYGRIIAYHFHKNHPGDALTANLESVRIPANKIIQVFKAERAGQRNGLPWLATVLSKLYELDQYDDAELVRKKIAAMYTAFVTKDVVTADEFTPGETPSEDPGVNIASLEPGTMQYLLPGEDVKFAAPADLGENYKEFMRVQLQAVAVGLGVLYEQISGDLRGVSYSSIRSGVLEFRKKIVSIQTHVIAHQLCRPVYDYWVKKALLSGALKFPADYEENKAEYHRTTWVTPGFDWVDPLKDVQATIKEMRAGMVSRSTAVAKKGYDVLELDNEIKYEQDREKELGLIFESNAGNAEESKTKVATTDKKLLEDAGDKDDEFKE